MKKGGRSSVVGERRGSIVVVVVVGGGLFVWAVWISLGGVAVLDSNRFPRSSPSSSWSYQYPLPPSLFMRQQCRSFAATRSVRQSVESEVPRKLA